MNLTEKVAAASVAALIASSAAYVSQMDSPAEPPAEPPAEKVVETDSYTDPCPYTSEVEHLTCELNENGYNVSEDDVVKLVRTIYFEGHWDGGQHEYDTVAWSMRNQLDLGQYIRDEGLDTSSLKVTRYLNCWLKVNTMLYLCLRISDILTRQRTSLKLVI